MTALAPAATQARAAAPALTFDERLALSPLAMDSRLDLAGLAFDVNTAGIEADPLPEILTAPTSARVQPATVAGVLREARRILADPERGWCKKWLGDGVRACSKGAIREAAGGGGGLADKAEAVLLGRIQAQVPDAQSIGGWNDAQPNVTPVLRMFDQAARHADRDGV
jgi:hypothetical protein